MLININPTIQNAIPVILKISICSLYMSNPINRRIIDTITLVMSEAKLMFQPKMYHGFIVDHNQIYSLTTELLYVECIMAS